MFIVLGLVVGPGPGMRGRAQVANDPLRAFKVMVVVSVMISGSVCKLPSSCPPAWRSQSLFCTAVPDPGESGGSRVSSAEFAEVYF